MIRHRFFHKVIFLQNLCHSLLCNLIIYDKIVLMIIFFIPLWFLNSITIMKLDNFWAIWINCRRISCKEMLFDTNFWPFNFVILPEENYKLIFKITIKHIFNFRFNTTYWWNIFFYYLLQKITVVTCQSLLTNSKSSFNMLYFYNNDFNI